MASQQLKDQLVKHIDDAYAMEQNVLRMLDGMIGTTEDAEIKDELRHHKLEMERLAERAGDAETAEAARENRKDEEAMAKKLEAHWDKFTELSLKEEGVTV